MFVVQSGASLPGRMNIVFAKSVLKLSLSWHPCLPPAGGNSLHKNACLSRLSSQGLQSLIVYWALSGVESEVANLCGSEAEQNSRKLLPLIPMTILPVTHRRGHSLLVWGGYASAAHLLPIRVGRRGLPKLPRILSTLMPVLLAIWYCRKNSSPAYPGQPCARYAGES